MHEKVLLSQKMRVMPIGKLLISMSVPAILSMLVQALYNVVDTLFVSRYDASFGVKALGVAFPLQMLIIAFAMGIGVGANAQISKKLGEGKVDEANQYAKTGAFLAVVAAIVFVVLGLTVVKPFVSMYTSNEQVAKMSSSYLTVVMCLSAGSFVEIVCSKILQATGNMKVPMISQMIGAVTNIILDPLFIFGYGFFPRLGITGAAVATVIGQFLACAFVVTVMFAKKHDVSISPRGLKLKWSTIAGICTIGLPTTVMNAIASVTTASLNLILKPYANGIDILAIYFKVQSFVFMPVFGLTQGLLPILSYNYGYGDKKRFINAYKLALVIAVGFMSIGILLFMFGAPLFMKLFNMSGSAIGEGATALRVICICFLPAAFGITMTTTYQSLGKGVTSLIMSLCRQLALLIPIALLLNHFLGMVGVWASYPVAEIIVASIFVPYGLHVYKVKFRAVEENKSKHLGDQDATSSDEEVPLQDVVATVDTSPAINDASESDVSLDSESSLNVETDIKTDAK